MGFGLIKEQARLPTSLTSPHVLGGFTINMNKEKDYIQISMENKVIGKTHIDNYEVSTVYLSNYIDDNFNNIPQWETMIFPIRKDGTINHEETYCRRFSTLQQAIKGHEEAVLYQMDSTYIRNENGYIKWNYDEEKLQLT